MYPAEQATLSEFIIVWAGLVFAPNQQNYLTMIEEIKEFIKSVEPEMELQMLSTNKEVIDQLDFAQGEQPKKFANSIGALLEIVEKYILEVSNLEKFQLVDTIISSFESYPSTIRKNPSRIEKVFDLICRVMANISETVPPIWFNPPEDYSEDNIEKLDELDADNALVCRFRSLMDRLSLAIGYEKMITIIESKLLSQYQSGDWRWKNATLMCISQLSEDLNVDKIENLVKIIKIGVSDSHPKVRYAAIQALGQYSDDLKPTFQEKYFKQFMPIIINGFDDKVQRVASHWMACMTNFIQDYTSTVQIMPFVNPLMNKICQFLEQGSNSAKQNAIATLASLVTVPSLFDKSTINKPFQICHSVLQAFSSQNCKQLINQTFECLTIIVSSQNYALIKDYIGFTVDTLTEICDKLDNEYLTAGWHRMCNIEHKFQNWQPLFKKVLEAVKSLPINSIKPGLNAIMSTVDCFKQDFNVFSSTLLPYLQNCFDEAINANEEESAIAAIETINQILIKAKPTNPDVNWDSCIKSLMLGYMNKTTQIIEESSNFTIAENVIDSVKKLVENYAFLLSQLEIVLMYECTWQIADKLQEKKKILSGPPNFEDEIDQDVLQEQREEEFKNCNSCKLSVPDLIKAILKISSSPKSMIANVLQHVSSVVTNSLDDQDLRYATYFLDNLLEDFDYSMLSQYWGNIYNYLSTYSLRSETELRNSAIFGIGVIAEKTPIEFVNLPLILSWVEIAKQAYSLPKQDKNSKRCYGHCQDNCIAVIGKIIQRFNKMFDLKFLYIKWLEVLPLKFDSEENRIQMRFICKTMETQPEVFIDASQEGVQRLNRIIKIFAELISHLRKKKCNEQNSKILILVRQTIMRMRDWPIFKQNQAMIASNLNNNQQFQIQELLANQILLPQP